MLEKKVWPGSSNMALFVCCSVLLGRSLQPCESCTAIGWGCFQATHYLLNTLLVKIDSNDGKDRTQAHLVEPPQEIFSFCTN